MLQSIFSTNDNAMMGEKRYPYPYPYPERPIKVDKR